MSSELPNGCTCTPGSVDFGCPVHAWFAVGIIVGACIIGIVAVLVGGS